MGQKVHMRRDDAHKDELMRTMFKNAAKVDVSRFKGLGEMLPAQLKRVNHNDPGQNAPCPRS